MITYKGWIIRWDVYHASGKLAVHLETPPKNSDENSIHPRPVAAALYLPQRPNSEIQFTRMRSNVKQKYLSNLKAVPWLPQEAFEIGEAPENAGGGEAGF